MERRVHLTAVNPAVLVTTDTELVAISSTGSRTTLVPSVSGYRGVEVVGNTIYAVNTARTAIVGYNTSGTQISSTPVPASITWFIRFTALNDGRFALYDNSNDKIYFINAAGDLLHTSNVMDPADTGGQNMDGVQVGNRLIIAENGEGYVLAVDLNTYAVSTFMDLSGLPTWVSGMEYSGGTYYVGSPQTVRQFTDGGVVSTVGSLPASNITSLAVYGGYAYMTVNDGALYRMDLATGSSSMLYGSLYNAQDVELAPGWGTGPLVITGTSGNDTISLVQSGDDLAVTLNSAVTHHSLSLISTITVNALAGDDTVSVDGDISVTIDGGLGNDSIAGGNGADYIRGDGDCDTIAGGGGADTLFGNTGNDSISGGDGDDQIQGGLEDDVLNGNDGMDLIYGGIGNDQLSGQGKSDTLNAGGGNDSLAGGAGNDWLYGEDGNDLLDAQDDHLFFADQADGGAGTDWSDFDDNDTVVSCQSILA